METRLKAIEGKQKVEAKVLTTLRVGYMAREVRPVLKDIVKAILSGLPIPTD